MTRRDKGLVICDIAGLQICRANQWTGFYMIGTSVMKELIGGLVSRKINNFIRNASRIMFLCTK